MAIDWSDTLWEIGQLHAARRKTRNKNRSVKFLVRGRERREKYQNRRSKWSVSGRKK
jgi:hypothetical protein